MIVNCGDCGARMRLCKGTVKGKERTFYGCTRYPKCKGTASAHQATGMPMGTPADAATRLARVKAHWHFDKIWKRRLMSRTEAYAWLREVLGVSEDDAHFAQMDRAQCRRVARAAKELLDQRSPRARPDHEGSP